MEDYSEKKLVNTYYKDNSEKEYLLTNCFEEILNKNKKNNLIPNQIDKYIIAIQKGIDTLKSGDSLDNFYNKYYYENFSQKKIQNKIINNKEFAEFPKIKTQYRKSKTKPNDKNDINKKTNYNRFSINKNNILNKTFNINKIKVNNKIDIIPLTKEKRNSKNIISRQSFLNPLIKISNTDDKNFYIKNHNLNNSIYNITEEGKVIEKKLYKKEKKKYFSGFKTKYKGLMKKSKHYVIDINEYINGKGGNKNKLKNNLLNKYKIIKVQNVLNQINRNIKKINYKEKMSDIIEDIKQYKQKEKYEKDKFEKTDEKFNNLIYKSNLITKRILKTFENKKSN